MKSVLSLITTIIFVTTSSIVSKSLYQQIKVESLEKVDQGLGSLSNFAKNLTKGQK
jgi:hypothetical protein